MKQSIKTQITSICMLCVSVFGWGSKVRNVDENNGLYPFSSNVRLLNSYNASKVNLTRLPVSPSIKYGLFKIQRSKDRNEIRYDINQDVSGNLISSNPIDIYWIRNSEGGKKEALNTIQRKYAYGLKFISVKNHEASFQFVSYDKRTFTLKKDKSNQFKVYVTSMNKQVELCRIYIHVNGGSFWFPKITKVELHGKDSNGKTSLETIIP